MSITDQIERIRTNLANTLAVLSGMGVDVSEYMNSDDLAPLVAKILETFPTKVSAFENDAGYLTKHQGSANVGKILVVGTDGNLTLTDMPEGSSGDVTGVLDESKNILLTGNLADGTYTLKYKNEDGTFSDAGTLTVGETEEEIINRIPLSTDASGNPFNNGQGWKTGYRISGSSGNESSQTGTEVTGFIPVKWGDTIRLKGITDDGSHIIGFYDSAYATHKTGTFNQLCGGAVSGEVVSFKVDNKVIAIDSATVAYMRVSASEITAESIITVNQEIS